MRGTAWTNATDRAPAGPGPPHRHSPRCPGRHRPRRAPRPGPVSPRRPGPLARRAGSRARRWPRTNSLRESSSRSSSATLSRCAGGSGHGSGSTPGSGTASIAALRGGSRTRPAQPGLEPAPSDASGPAQAQPGQSRPAPALKGPRRPALAGGTDTAMLPYEILLFTGNHASAPQRRRGKRVRRLR